MALRRSICNGMVKDLWKQSDTLLSQWGLAPVGTSASWGLKFWKPTSNGQRFRVTVDRKAAGIWPGKPYKPLTKGMSKTGGRNHTGRTTVWHRGGGNRKKYRTIDLKRSNEGTVMTVERLEHDPNRSGYIALVKSSAGDDKPFVYNYILAPQDMNAGDQINSGPQSPVKPGNTFQLKDIPAAIRIHNIELRPGGGGQLCRAAGTSATMLSKEKGGYAVLRLPSGEQRKVLSSCRATIGVVSNPQHKNRKLGKGGITRWMGRRPVVRGVAMNPVDHAMGGGEGKSSGGRLSCSPWGKLTKGMKTRKNKRTEKYIVVKRHRAKK